MPVVSVLIYLAGYLANDVFVKNDVEVLFRSIGGGPMGAYRSASRHPKLQNVSILNLVTLASRQEAAKLQAMGVQRFVLIRAMGSIRTCTNHIDNPRSEHGPSRLWVTPWHIWRYVRQFRSVKAGQWFAYLGSLPPRMKPRHLAKILLRAMAAGANTLLDIRTDVLETVLALGAVPTVIKLSDHELVKFEFGHLRLDELAKIELTPDMVPAIVHTSKKLPASSIVVVTFGAKCGVVVCTPWSDRYYWLDLKGKIHVLCDLGSGDSGIAWFLIVLALNGVINQAVLDEAARDLLLAGTANAGSVNYATGDFDPEIACGLAELLRSRDLVRTP
jgi:fructose-1-phosphate kinase PfkB-like protein